MSCLHGFRIHLKGLLPRATRSTQVVCVCRVELSPGLICFRGQAPLLPLLLFNTEPHSSKSRMWATKIRISDLQLQSAQMKQMNLNVGSSNRLGDASLWYCEVEPYFLSSESLILLFTVLSPLEMEQRAGRFNDHDTLWLIPVVVESIS